MTHDPKEALRNARRQLEIAGSPSPARDASALLDAVQRDASPWSGLSDAQVDKLSHFVERRARREPISHIVGKRAFWMHDFEVTADVLDPRPDTETLVETALTVPFKKVLDLGTGSGCILLSLLHERPEAQGMGTDISENALKVAARNAERVGVADRARLVKSDWFGNVTDTFDLIVSNPPYIAKDEMPGLAPELSYEPRIALTDEADGLTAYRAITGGAGVALSPGGRLMVEIGPTQATDVTALFAANGFSDVTVTRDIDGRDRVVSGVLSPQIDSN